MSYRRLLEREWILVGLVLGVMVLTVSMLTFAHAQGSAASITIVKEPDQMVVRGSTATFAITITNTGDVTLTNVTVSDVQAPECGGRTFAELPAGESESYDCTVADVVDSFTNSATATGTPPIGDDVVDTDTASVDVINPGIEIAKMPDLQMVVGGSTVTFTVAVTNSGDVTLTNVTVSDAQAPDCTRVIGELASGEGTSYACTRSNVTADFTNSVTATGTPPVGVAMTDTDTASVDVINPSIEIAKMPDVQVVAGGSTVSFTIAITNTGDASLANVTVSDALAPGCGQTFATLSRGANRRYDCSVANVTDGFINTATVTGRSPAGGDVRDSDSAIVRLDETLTCPADMASYWKLDETGGTSYDDHYNGHDGVCAGQCPTPSAARINGGQAFNGNNTGIDVPAMPGDDSFNWGADDSFSVEFWMKADSAHSCSLSNEVIVGRHDSLNSQLHWWVGIGCSAGGKAEFVLRDRNGSATGIVVGTTSLTDASWYHIMAVRDASMNRNRIYVNGTEEANQSVDYSAGFDSPTAALSIGWLALSHGYHLTGIVDEVAIYDRALSAQEIRQHYDEGRAGRWYCQAGTFAPIIVSTPLTEVTAGQLYSYEVEAVGNPVPTYTLVGGPNGMTIDPVSGLISWTPAFAQAGNHNVEVEASNSEGTGTQSFTIVVLEGTICPAGMLAYWKLDETDSTTCYDFYDGHDGTCGGQCPTPTTGHIGGGQRFNGSNTAINVPANDEFDWGRDDSFSIEFWLQTDSASTCAQNEVVVGRDDSSTSLHWWVGCENGGNAAFYLTDTGGTIAGAAGTTDLTDGSWHHVVAVRDAGAGEVRIYVDGVEEGAQSATYNAGFGSLTAALNIGWLNLSLGYYFDGVVDEVALYDVALPGGEIQRHYNEGEASPGYCINPDIAVSKMASAWLVHAGDTVTYTYMVTSPGDTPLSLGLRDDRCSPVTFTSGDDDGDGRLDPIEAWVYHCQMSVGDDVTNTVTVTGTYSPGGIVTDTDTIFVDVRDSVLTIFKQANQNYTLFEFTVTDDSSSDTLYLKNGESVQFSDLAPGSYTITEAIPAEWAVLSITCTNGISLTAPSIPAVTVNLQSKQGVGCVYTNYRPCYTIFLPAILKG